MDPFTDQLDEEGSLEKQTVDSMDDLISSKPTALSENTSSNVDLLSDFDALGGGTAVPVSTTPAAARSDKTSEGFIHEEVAEKVAPGPNIAPHQPSQVSKPSDKPNVMESEPTSTTKCCPFTSAGWWNAKCLHPVVEELVYWRCPKKSGVAFAGGLVLLLSLTCFSLISVVAHVALGALVVAIAFRIYKNVLQAIQKSSEGHPFKELLEKDIALPKQRVQDATETAVKHVEHAAVRLRSLFLVEDLVDSLKLAVILWMLTYVGSWFNGMTLIILGYVALFTLPKVYETYKVEIDKYVALARTQVGGVLGSIKSKIPVGQKPKEQ